MELEEEQRDHLLALAHLEAALIEQTYGSILKSGVHLAEAQEAAGFFAELTG